MVIVHIPSVISEEVAPMVMVLYKKISSSVNRNYNFKRSIYLFFLFLNLALHAQIGEFRNVNSDGIVDFQVNCLFKCSKGFIWTGGTFMVQRFDGKYIKTYKTPSEVKKVNHINESLEGTLFFATSNGLYSLKRNESELKPVLPQQLTTNIFTIYIDENNTIYIGTESGLSILKNETLNTIDFKNLDFPYSQVIDIEKTANNILWLLTPGGIISYDINSDKKRHYPFLSKTDNSYCTSMTLVDSILFVGTKENGIFSFNTETKKINSFLYVGNGSITSISSDKKSKLYTGTGGTGVFLISIADKKVYRSFNSNPGSSERISSNMITTVMVDDLGILWIGSYEHLGFDYMFLEPKAFKFYSTSSFTTKNIPINQFYIGNEFNLLTSLYGVYYISKNDEEEVYFFEAGLDKAKNLEPGEINTITPYDNKIILGGESGIFVFDPSEMSINVFNPLRILNEATIHYMTTDKQGNLWVASSIGLYILEKETEKVNIYHSSNSNLLDDAVNFIYFDSKNRKWICTDKGVCFWDDKMNDFFIDNFPEGFIDKSRVHHILEDRKGNFIFCYNIRNVMFSEPDFNKFRKICTEEDAGFTGLHILKTLQEKSGSFWFIGSRGGFRANEVLTKFELYSVSEGLFEPYATDGHLDSKDNLWLSNNKGLYHATGNYNKQNAPLSITDITVNGNSIINEAYVKIENDETIVFKRKQNNIKFQFALLDYTRPDLMVYECRLSNIDDWWNISRGLNSIHYKDLKPGKYTFTVRHNMDKAKNKQIHFEIKPLLSYSEIGLILVLLSGIGWFVIKLYRSKKNIPKQATEKQTKAETQEDQKYKFNKINEDEAKAIIVRLNKCMEEKHLYLNENLKIPDLAREVNCSNQTLSQVFNVFMNQSYYDFINGYRIKEFKKIISTAEHSKYTLKALAKRSGFSSYTTFYRAFKEQTGITPNQFIQKQNL